MEESEEFIKKITASRNECIITTIVAFACGGFLLYINIKDVFGWIILVAAIFCSYMSYECIVLVSEAKRLNKRKKELEAEYDQLVKEVQEAKKNN